MKRNASFVLAATLILSLGAPAQTVIENPARPSSRKAGRVVTLKEEMRIEDTGEGFYFKNAFTIRVSPDGGLLIQDGQDQALQFDPQGRFVRNLLKKGQGPGELTGLFDIWASRDNFFLLGFPPKILVYDHDGNLVREIVARELGWGRFILADKTGFIIHKGGRPDPSAGGGFKDIPQDIIELSPDGNILKTIGSFPIRGFVQVFEGGSTSMTTWNQLKAVPLDGNTIAVNSTPEYGVDILSRDKGVVVRRFRRPYDRVKRRGGGVVGSGGSAPPPPELDPDIADLHFVDGKIYVQTSTVVEGKGIVFDVFELDGRYTDCFFVKSPLKDPSGKMANMKMTIAGGCVYFRDKTDDDLVVIRKCRLIGL